MCLYLSFICNIGYMCLSSHFFVTQVTCVFNLISSKHRLHVFLIFVFQKYHEAIVHCC